MCELLEAQGVAVTLGLDLCEQGARHHLRFVYARGQEQMGEALERIKRFVGA